MSDLAPPERKGLAPERTIVSSVHRGVGRTIAALSLLAAAQAFPQPMPARLEVTPAAQQLFERDWVLMNWALKFYDFNHDMLLDPAEAQAAAAAFRKMADTNGDGRITPQEYQAARELILARY